MKTILFLLYLSTLVLSNRNSIEVEETTTELCSNGTEDSCEAFSSTETETEIPIGEITKEVTKLLVTTKKPKTTTAKIGTKKINPTRNSTGSLKPYPDCFCDSSLGDCEMDCCCDIDCSADQRAVFTRCLRTPVVVDSDHCFPQSLLYSNQTDYQTVETEPGVLCVLHRNTLTSTDFTDVSVIRTVAALESKIGQNKYFSWPNPSPSQFTFDADISYGRGSPIWITDNTTITQLVLPASTGHSSVCHSSVIPKYLEECETSCTQLIQTKSDCINSADVRYSVISSPRIFNFTQPQECTDDVCLPIQRYICSTTCLEGIIPHSTFNESNKTCQNLVESIEYKVYHNGTQGIVEVKAFYTLKNVSIHSKRLFRKYYKVKYIWAGSTDQFVLKRSGRPGYETGKPIISGRQAGKSVEFNVSATNWISVGVSGIAGLCTNRYNLLFGENIRTQCRLLVNGTCKQMQEQIWHQMLGTAANLSETLISSYGDPRSEEKEAWVPILSADLSPSPALTTAVNIIIVHSFVGQVAFPQSKIVAAYLDLIPSTKTCDSNHSTVTVETSVRFIDKTNPAVIKFAQPPVYEIKLPRDFFYPFLSSASKTVATKGIIIAFLFCIRSFILL